MRKVALCAAGFTAAVLLSHYVLPLAYLPWFAGVLAVLSLGGLLLKGRARLAALLLCLSAAAGFGWTFAHWLLFIAPADALVGETMTAHAVVLDYTDVNDGYTRTEMLLCEDGLPRTRVMVYDYDGEMQTFAPGDEAVLTLRFVSALERRGEHTDTYAANGVYVRAYLEGGGVSGTWHGRFLLFPRTLAKMISDQADACFPADAAPFMKALLTGDKSDIYRDSDGYIALQTAGLAHVVAVSGLHVSFLIGAVRLLTRRRRRTAAIGIPMVLVFMAMAGFTPSVTRAGLMQIMMLTAPLLRREEDTPTSLSLALLLILLVNPEAIGSVGLQLSFASMAGIGILSGRIYAALTAPEAVKKRRVLRACALITANTVGVMAFTVPLLALYFGYVPLYALLSNLLCLWAATVCFVLGYVTCLAGLLWHTAGAALGFVTALPARYILLCARLIARLPYAALYTEDNYIAWWVIFVYAVFLLGFALKGQAKFRPVLPVCACIITFLAVTLYHLDVSEGSLTVTALDVGQGQCVVAMQPNSVVVIDCGGINTDENAGDVAAAYLAGQGRRRIDLLVLTHLHADHVNGVERLFSRMEIERIALPEDADDAGYTDKVLSAAQEHGAEIYYVTKDTDVELGRMSLTLYAPLGSASANERGVIVLGKYDNFEYLVTGDADTGTENLLTLFYELPDIELLVVGHHGSRYSTGTALLEETKPDAAFISVGWNTYGHPTDEVLERLAGYGVAVYRTDLEGNLSLSTGAGNG